MVSPGHESMLNGQPKLLFIDAYDSFSNNIISLLKSQLSADVTTVRIDDSCFLNVAHDSMFHAFISSFDAVLVGPGPGDPRDPKDTGVINKLWRLPEDLQRPVLGICLGFQCLVLAFGGDVATLSEPRHGLIKPVRHADTSLFAGVGEVKATQYHSWHARLGHQSQADEATLWQSTEVAAKLQPLAWDMSDAQNGPILMAVKHVERPLWGVQYHPESICTNAAGTQIIQNWWIEARAWTIARQRMSPTLTAKGFLASHSLLDSGYGTESDSRSPSPNPRSASVRPSFDSATLETGQLDMAQDSLVSWKAVDVPMQSDMIPALSDLIRASTGSTPIVLEAGTKLGKPVRAETGRFSILGLLDNNSTTFEYWTDQRHFITKTVDHAQISSHCDVHQAFDQLKSWVLEHKASGGPVDVPFWGGLIGYASYEAGLESIDVRSVEADATGPDLSFVAIARSVVVDHVKGRIYLQTLLSEDDSWLDGMHHKIDKLVRSNSATGSEQSCWTSTITKPEKQAYCNKVELCQRYIRAGDSYELCLTDRSPVHFGSADCPSPLQLYHRLRQSNPAPFSAFLDLPSISLISSSPERFLSWTRSGLCEFRPIKGTVQKRPDLTRADAEAILKSDKEQAENLMIVDLIRHDLNGVVNQAGSSASVPKLMQVEEYETVYQLVSVIQGQLNDKRDLGQTGVDVLAASLPPGSMTGAPKKRSCEILGQVEGRRRGAYSGVLGYLDVGGGGDFSVIIRSLIKDARGWGISAGGAVTVLSDPVSEWEEMLAKSSAVKI